MTTALWVLAWTMWAAGIVLHLLPPHRPKTFLEIYGPYPRKSSC